MQYRNFITKMTRGKSYYQSTMVAKVNLHQKNDKDFLFLFNFGSQLLKVILNDDKFRCVMILVYAALLARLRFFLD